MEFRLTYAGPLLATQRDATKGQKPNHRDNKHYIRSIFHKQLRKLWYDLPALNGTAKGRPPILADTPEREFKEPLTEINDLAARHAKYNFNFVPLVTQEMDLLCGLDILFLRPDKPGKIWAGDIDNRLKTLLDALRIPEDAEGYSQRTASDDEKPFFCLLEDDRLITKVSVETDRLLQPIAPKSIHDARLVITVRLKPYELNIWNMHFG